MDQTPQNDVVNNQQAQSVAGQPAAAQPLVEVTPVQPSSIFKTIQRATAWVMIVSAVAFALIGILAVWQVFGEDAGDVVWRALSSLAIIAFAALIINVSVRMVEDHRK